MAVKGLNSTSAVSPESYRHYTPEYFEGSSSTLSSVSEDLYCSARADKTYYRVDPGDNLDQSTREDQATQTDDEADLDTPKKIARPTSFNCSKYPPVLIHNRNEKEKNHDSFFLHFFYIISCFCR